MRLGWITSIAAGALLAQATVAAMAQTALDSEKEIEHYREMINDPMSNPGYLAVDRGEALWKTARGTKNVGLETCDLGQGPGKLEGAYAALPRYFADADQVMDVEQRLLFCMRTVQGLDTADVIKRRFSGPGVQSDMEDLVAYIANQSNGMPIAAPLAHTKEKQAYAIGEALFFRRGGQWDFSCATCHGEDGRRIRLQALPNLAKAGKSAQTTMATWPAYRVSQSNLRTMQHRLWDCFRQMRWPAPEYASEGITALTVYLQQRGAGGELQVPSIKR